jgi:hypothetical protein
MHRHHLRLWQAHTDAEFCLPSGVRTRYEFFTGLAFETRYRIDAFVVRPTILQRRCSLFGSFWFGAFWRLQCLP